MKKYVISFFLMSIAMVSLSQNYWSKTYDPFGHEADDIRNIVIKDDVIYASSRGTCLKDSVAECAKMVKFNLLGDYLDGYVNPLYETGYGLGLDNDWLYVDGGNEPYNDKIFASRTSIDFAQNELIEVSIDSSFSLVNRSSILYENNLIIFGSYKDSRIVHDTCKWLEDEAEWFYTPWSIDFQDRLAKIEIISDTLIGNRLCSVLGLFEEDEFVENSDLVVFYERENEKVYFNENDTFKLMYDFSLSVLPGDTVEFYLPQKLMYYDISSSGGDFLPSDKPYLYRNIDQNWVTSQNGEQLRIVRTEPLLNQDGECFDLGNIINGVGSDFGLMGRYCAQLLGGKPEYFRCFKSNSLEYTEVNGECLVTSTDDYISSDLISISPNPVSDLLHIEADIQLRQMILRDITGQVHYSGAYRTSLDMSEYPRGVYLLTLMSYEGLYVHRKVLRK